MERKDAVLKQLKPQVASLGFSKKEVESIAALVADNLNLEEEATEEEVNDAIANGIESYLPFLKVGQQMATRLVNAKAKEKPKQQESVDDAKKDDDEESEEVEKVPSYVKTLLDQMKSLNDEVVKIKAGKVTDSRKAKLETLLKDAGTFGKSTLKSFSHMTFEDDDAFDQFYSEVENDLKEINNERTNAGLSKLGTPAAGAGSQKHEEVEKLSDADVDALVANM